jgi:hypothetical protein
MCDDLPRVECDGSQVQQMVLALAINAVEATQTGGNVTARAPNRRVIQVRDNGRALEEHWRKFSNHSSPPRKGERRGLGLPVYGRHAPMAW